MDEDDTPSDVPTARMLRWARNSALYRLGRQMMSQRQLSDAIARKARQKFDDISPAQIAAVAASAVDYAHSLQALDDTAYAAVSTRTAVRSGRSRRAIAQRLQIKGIDAETATLALDAADDRLAAVIFARKRAFGPFRRVDMDEHRRAKELSAFGRQGYSFDIGRLVVGMDIAEAEDILNGVQRL